MTDKTPGAYTRHEEHAPTYWKGVVREYKDALEKAEQERDEWEKIARTAERDADEAEENPRPLTADDITDEMIDRARNAPTFDGRLSPTPRLVREMLTAALTEPPARPEWADLGEALDRLWPHGTDGIAREDIARRLHTEAGVRVVGEDEENR